jgi:HK97 family phage major capsid protein
MSKLLTDLSAKGEKLLGQINLLNDEAHREDRDLTEGELAIFRAHKAEYEAISERIKEITDVEQAAEASAAAVAGVTREARGELVTRQDGPDYLERTYPTPGHYIADFVGADRGDADAAARLERAVSNVTPADVAGLLPTEILGPVIDFQDARRALFNAIPVRTPTSGPTFNRPVVSQHTNVGKQSASKAELPSRAFQVTNKAVTLDTYGGVVDLDLAAVRFSEPSLWNAVVADLWTQYAIQTEALAGTTVNTIATAQKITALADTKPETILGGIFAAAAKVYTNTGMLPDFISVSADTWQLLGSLVDGDNRPYLPTLGATNAAGTASAASFGMTISGIPVVVSTGLPAKSLVVGSSAAFEMWEVREGVLQVTEPRLNGVEVAVVGYVGAIDLSNGAVQVPLP